MKWRRRAGQKAARPDRVRVLFVTPLYLPWLGGLEVLSSQILAELRRRGHEVAVLTAVNDLQLPLGRTVIDGVPVCRTDVYQFRTRQDPRALLHDQRTIRQLAQEFRPDLAHAHDAGPLLWLYRRSATRVPLVVTLHNVMSQHAAERTPAIARLLSDADAVTGVSEDVVADTLEFAPHVAGKISVIPNGIALGQTTVEALPDGPPTFVCVGRLVTQKGFDRAVEAFAAAFRGHPGARLLIAGEGPEDDALVALAGRLKVDGQVRLLGRVEHDDIAELISASTAVVMPSRFEGLPLVALEAARHGRAVVGMAAPGLRRIVVDGVTGLLVADGDTAALARAMSYLAGDRRAAAALGLAGRRHVAAEQSLERCVDAYERLYTRCLAQARVAS
jgi:glycosyltransferase involved in cell wall biosynthesis